MINFLFCTVLPPGASKVDQTHKFDDFLDLTQFFQIRQESVLIKINYVKIDVINNFELHDELSRIHSFHSKSLWSWQHSAILQKKSFFGQLWRLPEGEQLKIGRLSSWYKLFKIPFLTTFISTKTIYEQFWISTGVYQYWCISICLLAMVFLDLPNVSLSIITGVIIILSISDKKLSVHFT